MSLDTIYLPARQKSEIQFFVKGLKNTFRKPLLNQENVLNFKGLMQRQNMAQDLLNKKMKRKINNGGIKDDFYDSNR